MKFLLISFAISLSLMLQTNAQHSLQGIWEGGITVPGGQLKIVFNIEKTTGGYSGTLDIPQQGVKGLRFDSISEKNDSIRIVFSAGQITGTFTGVFESETKITGSYSQGGPSTTFSVERTSDINVEPEKPKNETDYIIPNGNIEIGGTLTLPDGPIKGPLLIMSSGSAAQDRDSNIYDFKIFAVIAQHLAKQGIPSFRYDDRGIGKSSGDFSKATLDDLALDVNAIITFFQNNDENRFENFAVLGHSQGGVVAGKVAAENDAIDQLILMGSTAPALSEILRYQVELAYANTPVEKSFVEKEIDARETLMKTIVEETDVEQAKENYAAAYANLLNELPDAQKNSIPDITGTANNQAAQLVFLYGSPQMKSLLFYVPADDLKEIDIPVLVLFGGKDIQVTVAQNQAGIQAALETSGTDYEVKIFDEANHLFQKANTGMVNEYPFLEKAFVDGFLQTISTWILNN